MPTWRFPRPRAALSPPRRPAPIAASLSPRPARPVSPVVSPRAGGGLAELSDAPSPSGRLADRVTRLRQRCVRALGYEQFTSAYTYLKSVQDDEDVDDGLEAGGETFGGAYDADEQTQLMLLRILGPDKVHFSSLIDQLIFMEDSLY